MNWIENEKFWQNQTLRDHSDDFCYTDLFLGSDKTRKNVENILIVVIAELLKTTTTKVLLTGTLSMETVIKETSEPVGNIEEYVTWLDYIQLKYVGDKIVFTGHSFEVHDSPFEKLTVTGYCEGSDFLTKTEEYQGKNCFIPPRNNILKMCLFNNP